MTIRNKKAAAVALGLRARVATILLETSYIVALSHKNIAAQLGGKVPIKTVRNTVAWIRREYAKDQLNDFVKRVNLARQGFPAPFDGST